jgi:hypothetical protein
VPKRSNEYQRLVRRVYSLTRSAGATVTESALVRSASGVEREVDVLIEFRAADTDFRIAVECRDQRRAATVEWIDSLIGKYRDMPVHRIIAVARSGFTKGAAMKAAAHQIETRTLSQALVSDWPAELLDPFLGKVDIDVCIVGFFPPGDRPWPRGTMPARARSGGRDVDMAEYLRQMTAGMRLKIAEMIAERKEFHSMNALNRRFDLIFKVNTAGTSFLSETGMLHPADETYVRCNVTVTVVQLPTETSLLGNIGVATAVDRDSEHGPLTLTIAQEPGRAFPLPIISRAGERDDESPLT